MKKSTEIMNFKPLAHPLSMESLTGCGFLLFQRPFFGGKNNLKKGAFTLAEVLITLVIIGVVAALTLPTLMTKYQQHVFENQFKKSLYTISQIVARMRSELGVSQLSHYCTEYTAEKGYYTMHSNA